MMADRSRTQRVPASRPLPALLLAGALASCGGPQGDPLLGLTCPAPTAAAVASNTYDGLDAPALEAKAEDGDRAAARVLGERYRTGLGVAADPARALAWTRRAAVVENTTTQFIVAPAVGKQPSFTVPINHTTLAAGDPPALVELGQLYSLGLGVPRDAAVARTLIECGRKGQQPWT
ncbi:MAG: hypothetical protein PW843_11095 [Azospirillaceae bacterium]|nr:hypothetical protein [Azospirillaceae bacterium]